MFPKRLVVELWHDAGSPWLFEGWRSRLAEAMDLLRAPRMHIRFTMITGMEDGPDRQPIAQRRCWPESLPDVTIAQLGTYATK